jgi:hypothetical protein
MGTTIGAAHKVFVVMPERKIFSNFGKILWWISFI